MDAWFELFDHTADMGLRIRATTMPGLLQPAAEALYSAIGELTAAGDETPQTMELTGGEPAELLRDFLTELLVLFERDGRIVTRISSPVLDESLLAATCWAAPIDEDACIFAREVKAITYHELDIRPIPGGFEATMIVDI